MTRPLCLAAAALTLASCAPAPQSVEEVFAEYTAEGSPGATVMVVRDGNVLHSAGYGLADIENGLAMEPTTPVRLGSVSKAFTAMAIVILEEQGRLTYDSPATEWVPEIARFPGVTVRHLMNHTAGLPDYYDDSSPLEELGTAEGREAPLRNAEAAAVYESWGEPVFAPGERFEYSNPGYELLALIVERISGLTFGEFLGAELFQPLGMRTAVVRELPSTRISRRAIGYSPDGGDWVENDDHWGNWLVGAGGVYASLEDMYLWDQALHEWADTGRMSEAFAPATLNDGTESDYGFGWNVRDLLDREAVGHTGGWVGFRTAFFRFVGEDLSVIVLTNSSAEAGELALQTAGLYLTDG